jgi:hypothetical protein
MTMFTKHTSQKLAAYLDGQLGQQEVRRIELHLSQCEDCRHECEKIRSGMEGMKPLALVQAPDAIWHSIESEFQTDQSRHTPARLGLRWAFAATLLLVLGATNYWGLVHRLEKRWEVRPLAGSPSVGGKPILKAVQIGAGEWIETDARSRATVKVGEIGMVEVAPNTRVQVVTERSTEHRFALTRGEIHAKISAPPKLFFVETASGTAVDLGCEYALSTDETGSGFLRVTKGWVAYQWKGRESLVPAGASCRTRPDTGPGLPYFDDASERLKQAIDNFGFEKAGEDALGIILAESRSRDTLTLWHLISRVDPGDRGRVFDRVAALTPVPAGVSRELALKLDPETLKRWKDELAWTW